MVASTLPRTLLLLLTSFRKKRHSAQHHSEPNLAAHINSNSPCLLGTVMNLAQHTHTLGTKQPVPQQVPISSLHPSIEVPSNTPKDLGNHHSTDPLPPNTHTHTTQTPSAIPSLHKNLETPDAHSRSAALSSRTATAIAATKILPYTTAKPLHTPRTPHSLTHPPNRLNLPNPLCLGNTNNPPVAIPRRNTAVPGEQRSSKSRVKSWHRLRSGCG